MLDLAVESARLEEQNKTKRELRELRELLNGSVYEEKTAEIIDFIGAKSRQGKKALYTGALHKFGREDGRAIYQLLKHKKVWDKFT